MEKLIGVLVVFIKFSIIIYVKRGNPETCRFLGIIYMNYGDHIPPHFLVRYNEYEASIRIDNFGIIVDKLPPKNFGLVAELAMIHQQ